MWVTVYQQLLKILSNTVRQTHRLQKINLLFQLFSNILLSFLLAKYTWIKTTCAHFPNYKQIEAKTDKLLKTVKAFHSSKLRCLRLIYNTYIIAIYPRINRSLRLGTTLLLYSNNITNYADSHVNFTQTHTHIHTLTDAHMYRKQLRTFLFPIRPAYRLAPAPNDDAALEGEAKISLCADKTRATLPVRAGVGVGAGGVCPTTRERVSRPRGWYARSVGRASGVWRRQQRSMIPFAAPATAFQPSLFIVVWGVAMGNGKDGNCLAVRAF